MIMPGSDKTFDTYPFIILEAQVWASYNWKFATDKRRIDSAKNYKSINFINHEKYDHILKLIKKLQEKIK